MELCQYLDVPSLTMFRWLRGTVIIDTRAMMKVATLMAPMKAGRRNALPARLASHV